jgi:hypothetical protein
VTAATEAGKGQAHKDKEQSFSARVSTAFRRRDFAEALRLLWYVEVQRESDSDFTDRIVTIMRMMIMTMMMMIMMMMIMMVMMMILTLLRAMHTSGEPPRLGALQRWVRDCDLAATER